MKTEPELINVTLRREDCEYLADSLWDNPIIQRMSRMLEEQLPVDRIEA